MREQDDLAAGNINRREVRGQSSSRVYKEKGKKVEIAAAENIQRIEEQEDRAAAGNIKKRGEQEDIAAGNI